MEFIRASLRGLYWGTANKQEQRAPLPFPLESDSRDGKWDTDSMTLTYTYGDESSPQTASYTVTDDDIEYLEDYVTNGLQ